MTSPPATESRAGAGEPDLAGALDGTGLAGALDATAVAVGERAMTDDTRRKDPI